MIIFLNEWFLFKKSSIEKIKWQIYFFITIKVFAFPPFLAKFAILKNITTQLWIN